ncbi:outer membrane adhesin-like protein, partial [Candidatus Magnetomorum sp. HK-1]
MKSICHKVIISISFLLCIISVYSPAVYAASISKILSQETKEGIAVSIPFLVTASGNTSITLTSSNEELVPNDYLIYESDSNNYTMVATPILNKTGTATISIAVSDDAGLTSTTFGLNVTDTNDSLSYWNDFQAADVILGESGVVFSFPSGVAIDPTTGKVFISDTFNNRILRFASAEAASLSGSSHEAVFGGTGVTADDTMNSPTGIHVDMFGNLWVADSLNNRILRFKNVSNKSSGIADGVLGQKLFTSNLSGTYTSTMSTPTDVWVDPGGRLWVADSENHRILRFDNPTKKENGANADAVLGQSNFTSSTYGTTQTKMKTPRSIIGSSVGEIFVADFMNRRVICFMNAAQKSYTANADIVLGQANFDNIVQNETATATFMNNPIGLAMDSYGRLYVADQADHRVLIFNDAINKSNGDAADYVIGQTGLNSGSSSNSGEEKSDKSLNYPSYINLDLSNNQLWVPDTVNNRTLRFSLNIKTAPILGQISSQTITENTISEPITFTVTDKDSESLTITYSFSNADLLTSNNFLFSGNQVVSSGNAYTVYATSTPTAITLNITPKTEKSGSSFITVTVIDPDGMAATTVFSLTVITVNDAPIITSIDDQTMNEDAVIESISFTVSDIEGNEMTILIESSDTVLFPSNADNITLKNYSGGNTYTLTTGSDTDVLTLSLKPTSNQSGSATITITVSDGANETNKNFKMTVNSVNDLPAITTIENQTIDEDQTIKNITFTVSDVDAAALTISVQSGNTTLIPSGADHITLSNQEGGISYSLTTTSQSNQLTLQLIPAANEYGNVTMTVTVIDDTSATIEKAFSLIVEPVNDSPTISSIPNQSTNEDQTINGITFLVDDIDSNNLTVTVQSNNTDLFPSNANNITLNNAGTSYFLVTSPGTLTLALMPTANQSGSATITVIVEDGTDQRSTAFSASVTPVDDTPTISSIENQETTEDFTGVTLTFNTINPDSDNLTISVVSENTTLLPSDNQHIVLKKNAVTGNPLTSNEENVVCSLTLIPAPDQSGLSMISVNVANGTETITRTFSFTVTPVNDSPTISNIIDQITQEDRKSDNIIMTVADADGDTLTIDIQSSNTSLISSDSQHLTLTNANGDHSLPLITDPGSLTLVLMPIANESGSATITIVLKDGQAETRTSFKITVTPENDEPVISAINDQICDEDQKTDNILFTVSDDDSDSLTIDVKSSNEQLIPADASHITLQNATTKAYPLITMPPASLTLVMMPQSNKSGNAHITVTVNDGTTTISTTFAITVTEINDQPDIFNLNNHATDEDTQISNVTFNVADVDATSLTISIMSGNETLLPSDADHITICNSIGCNILSLTTNAGADDLTIKLLPGLNQSGTAMLTVTVTDGITPTTQSFALTINPVNDHPVLPDIVNQIGAEDTPIAIPFTASDAEDASCSLTITIKSSEQSILADEQILITCNANQYTINANPQSNANGNLVMTIVATDTEGLTASMSFNLTITKVNDSPTISIENNKFTTKKNMSKSITGISIDDIDAGNNAILITLTAGADGTLTINDQNDASLSITKTVSEINNLLTALEYQPALSATGIRLITITVNDLGHSGSTSLSVSKTIQIEITDNNVAPENSVPKTLIMNEDETLSITPISVYDMDAANNPIHVTLTAKNAFLTLSKINGLTLLDGNYNASQLIVISGSQNDIRIAFEYMTLTCATDYNGQAIVTIATNDLGYSGVSGGPLSDSDSITITVLPVNDPPVNTLPESLTTNEDISKSFTAQVSDPDNLAINVKFKVDTGLIQLSATTGLSGKTSEGNYLSFTGTIDDLNNAMTNISYTPTANLSGIYAITMTICDANACDEDIMSLTITSINDAPTISCDSLSYSINEDTTFSMSAVITDVDAGNNEIMVSIDVSHGSLVMNTSNVTAVENGTHYTITGTIPNINKSLNMFTYTPTANYFGDAGITITVNDMGFTPSPSKSDQKVISIVILPVNDPPLFELSQTSITVPEDFSQSQIVTVVVNSIAFGESDAVNYTLSPDSIDFASIELASNSGTVTITHKADKHGNSVFTLTANDGASISNTHSEQFKLTVQPVNDPPSFSINPIAITLNEDFNTIENIGIKPDAVPDDENSQSVTYKIVPESLTWTNLSIDADTGQITLTKIENGYGSQIVQVIADDGEDNYTQTFKITVNSKNDAPVISTGNSFSVDENSTVGIVVHDVDASDAENDALTYNSTTVDPIPFTITPLTGEIWLSESVNYELKAKYTIAISVSDGTSADIQTLTVDINNINEAPVISAPIETLQAKRNTELTITTVSISDEDADSENVQLSLTADHGTVYIDTTNLAIRSGSVSSTILSVSGILNDMNQSLQSLSFNPTADYTGNASIVINVNDLGHTGSGPAQSAEQTIQINVNLNNIAPEIESIPITMTNEDELYSYSIIVSDENKGDNLSITAVYPNYLSFTDNGDGTALLSGTPLNEHVGSEAIVITATDGRIAVSQSYVLTVLNVNDAPSISNILNNTIYEDTATGPINFTIADADSNKLSITAFSSDHSLLLSENIIVTGSGNNRSIMLTPTANSFGSLSVTIAVTDGSLTETTTFLLTINSINDKPDFVINQEKIDVLEDFEGTETIVVTPLPMIPFGEENQSVIYSLSPASYTIANVSIDSETGLVSISKIDNMFGGQIITIIANDQQSQNNTYN